MSNKFVEYLKNRKESAYDFSKRSGIAINTVYRVLKGSHPRKDVAKKIVRATKKEITLSDFNYDKDRDSGDSCSMGFT